jgi:hypothetical protein
MNLSQISLPDISGSTNPAEIAMSSIAVAAATKTLQVQAKMGEDLVRLLDPSVGQHLNARG